MRLLLCPLDLEAQFSRSNREYLGAAPLSSGPNSAEGVTLVLSVEKGKKKKVYHSTGKRCRHSRLIIANQNGTLLGLSLSTRQNTIRRLFGTDLYRSYLTSLLVQCPFFTNEIVAIIQ